MSEWILNGTSAQTGDTVPVTLVYAAKYRTEDKLKIQTIQKLNTTHSNQRLQPRLSWIGSNVPARHIIGHLWDKLASQSLDWYKTPSLITQSPGRYSSSLFGIHHQRVDLLAANSLHSGLFRASSIASSKVRLCWARSFFRVAIQEV